VQLARHDGAVVTGVCSTPNVDLVASLGAATVIDYTTMDYAAGGPAYDVVMDAAGKTSRDRARAVLADGGRFVSVRSAATERAADLVYISGLLEQGAIRPVIDRAYSLERIREAHRYVEAGHKVGNVVITLDVRGARRVEGQHTGAPSLELVGHPVTRNSSTVSGMPLSACDPTD
jgi:NADPH:quinone reductase-like Zn-dependent oxidoreductase